MFSASLGKDSLGDDDRLGYDRGDFKLPGGTPWSGVELRTSCPATSLTSAGGAR
jgi:hypothetical protein